MFLLVGNLFLLAGLLVLLIVSFLRSEKLPRVLDQSLSVVTIVVTVLLVLGVLLTQNLLVGSLLIVMAVVKAARDSSRQDALLWSLAMTVDQGLPLAGGVQAFAEECRGPYRRRLLKLSEKLQAGDSLPQALSAVPKVLSVEGELSARVGSETGLLAQALREAAARRTFSIPLWYTFGLRILYLLGVLLFTQATLYFAMLFIIPKMRKITADLGIEMGGPAAWLNEVSFFCANHWFASLLAILLQLGLAGYLLMAVLGWVTWDLPFLRWFSRRLDSALVLRMLALVIESGKPLSQPLQALAAQFPRWSMRQRLMRVAQDVQGGQPWSQSLRRRGLIRGRDQAVLESAGRAGNLAWALRETADSSERRLGFRLQAWAQVLFPACVLFAALPIAVITLAFMIPLVDMMKAMS